MTLLEAIITGASPPPRRYPIEAVGTTINYGPWRIDFDPPPIPVRNCDWQFYHKDYDGAEDANDGRYGHAASFSDALNECDEMEDEARSTPSVKEGGK